MEITIARKMTGGYREYRIPGILCLQDTIFLAYEARAEESGDWGDIDVVVQRLSPAGKMQEILNLYAKTNPEGEFVGMLYAGGKLKVLFRDRLETVTMAAGSIMVKKEAV